MKFFEFAGNFEIKTLSLTGNPFKIFLQLLNSNDIFLQTNQTAHSHSPELLFF